LNEQKFTNVKGTYCEHISTGSFASWTSPESLQDWKGVIEQYD